MVDRRAVLAGTMGFALGGLPEAGAALAAAPGPMLSAATFGAVGDGVADDTAALQAALDATFSPGYTGLLTIPPGVYRVTRTLRVTRGGGAAGNVVRQSGILAHGARLVSAIDGGKNVFEFISRATVRFILIEGLDISGSGRDGHGIYLECDQDDNFLYNFCLRDVVVQNCGGDGCRMIGNVFEGQVINSYFRGNNRNGITFGHGKPAGILSAIHVFACVFGQNGQHGAALINNCYDVSFHGCYFLLNRAFGLSAENGCTLLSNCGFENNHSDAPRFEAGDAGIQLNNFGTLIGCTAYSVHNQTMLLRAFLVGRLVMVGCTGSGGRQAKAASLAKIAGAKTAGATVIGCAGGVQYDGGFEAVEIDGQGGGLRLGSHWQSAAPLRLGDYRLWVDQRGRLRMKNAAPAYDEDGALVGA